LKTDPIQSTVIYEPFPSASKLDQSSLGEPRAKVGFIAGDRPHFSDETAALLRRRLSAAALVIAVILAAAFIGNLVKGTTTLWWLRGLILLALVGLVIILRSRLSFSLFQLRVLELVVFGTFVVQFSLMLTTRMAEFAGQNDPTSVTAVRHQFLTAWCLLIFVYGIFMPNTWRRGAAIMVPIAIVPYIVVAVQRRLYPDLASLLDMDKAGTIVPSALVTACVATYAAHVINTARREAFKARRFGQYRLLERLGGGGMGEVFKAEHVLLKRPCALKLIKAASEADAKAISQFEKEVKTTAKLTHWNTVEIYDYGRTDDGTFYYVMELLLGMSLADLVEKQGPLPPERVAYLLAQVCGALQEAHSVGLIHRDIKPANIFAAQRGGVYDVAKLLDFGLVKERIAESKGRKTSYGSFSGTPLFMSPEQASAYEDVDERSDIYSLGAVAYYLLTGQPPFTGTSVLELLNAHRSKEVTPPSQLNPTIPLDLEQSILKCMAKNPANRFQDAASLMLAFSKSSVVGKWGPEQAAEWWRSAERTSNSVPTVLAKPAIEATIDYSSHAS
jgi:eukaryotic-like serine/threonine-protein kinase